MRYQQLRVAGDDLGIVHANDTLKQDALQKASCPAVSSNAVNKQTNKGNTNSQVRYTIIMLLAANLFAAEQSSISFSALGKAPAVRPAARAQTMDAASTSKVIQETLIKSDAPQTVPPNDFLFLEAKSDFTGADRVSISVISDTNTRPIAIMPAWAAPGNWYVLTDYSQFWAASNHTGLNSPVYGPFLKIGLYNTGTTPLEIKQLTVYSVIHQ
jgi:hypothetical protein